MTVQASFDASPDRVAAMMADERFVAAKVRASGASGQTVAVVGGPSEAFTVTTRRQMPTTGIPAQFRSMVGSTLEVRQVEAWEAPGAHGRAGTIVVEVTGAPVRMTGTMRMEGTAGRTTITFDGDLKASVPLFAGAIEEATAGAVLAALEAEERTGAVWLAGTRSE